MEKTIVQQLKLDDRIETLAPKDAFIIIKDHKTNSATKPICRLINRTKTEENSKQILDRVNINVTTAANVNQWKNTTSVNSSIGSMAQTTKAT